MQQRWWIWRTLHQDMSMYWCGRNCSCCVDVGHVGPGAHRGVPQVDSARRPPRPVTNNMKSPRATAPRASYGRAAATLAFFPPCWAYYSSQYDLMMISPRTRRRNTPDGGRTTLSNIDRLRYSAAGTITLVAGPLKIRERWLCVVVLRGGNTEQRIPRHRHFARKDCRSGGFSFGGQIA